MSSEPACLEVRALHVRWRRTEVLDGIDLDVAPGEFVALMGPNGSGKTTLLRTIAGFERPRSGSIRLGGRELVGVPAHRRGVGILFQEPALFPARTVRENIAYGLEIARRPPDSISARVRELVGLLRLEGLEGRGPTELSGGERQRVALARTLAPGPALVLLDEPFASVDPELRTGLRAEFRSALRTLGVGAIHVTHDREEGLFLGDRVLLLNEGRIVQGGAPGEVYHRPVNSWAARFLGYNVLRSTERTVAVEPHRVVIAPATDPSDGILGEVEACGPAPGGWTIVVRLSSGERVDVRRGADAAPLRVGERVALRWRDEVPLPDG